MADQTFGPEITARAFKENIRHLITDPFTAIIEIISNSWDSGAEEVSIIWPKKSGEEVIIEDDGEGMTEKEFREIWPKISYNRLKLKGKEVTFKREREGNREAYGQHGKGRHSPFCFAESYIVETWKDGYSSKFKVKRDKNEGFVNERLGIVPKQGNGTKISFKLNDNYKEITEIKKEIGARFLTDPSFKIIINGETITLDDLDDSEVITCKVDNEIVKILKIKSGEKSKNTHFHGVTWVIGIRRIKTTAWKDILDGRITEAKNYAYLVYSDILKNEINEQTSDFKKSDKTKRIQEKIIECIKKSVAKIMAVQRDEVKKEIITKNLVSIKEMSSTDQDEIGEFISDLQETRTAIKTVDLTAATEIFIKIQKSKSGSKFLNQLSQLDEEDIEVFSEILERWSIKEARIVLGLIHSRINLIKELELKTNDPDTLELEQLQPLFEEGLWIFGPEYESVEFTSNRALSTVARGLLNKKGFDAKESRLRPDFVVLPESSLGIHSCDKFDDDNESDDIEKILFIELKRGGFNIDLNERTQVENYINILIDGGAISKNVKIDAYVLGTTVSCEGVEVGERKLIKIIPKQYHLILKKAEKRLFNLRKKIEEAKKIKDEPSDPTVKEALEQSMLDDH
jgi:hypothetical protein